MSIRHQEDSHESAKRQSERAMVVVRGQVTYGAQEVAAVSDIYETGGLIDDIMRVTA